MFSQYKKFRWLLMSAMATFIFGMMSAAASSDIQMKDMDMDTQKIESQIKQAISLSPDKNEAEQIEKVVLGSTNVPEGVNIMEQQYCRYKFTENEIISSYRKHGDLASFISENYQLCVLMPNGEEIILDKSKGEWKFIGASVPVSAESSIDGFSMAAVSDTLLKTYKSKLPTNAAAVVSDLKIVRSHMYNITFAYFTDGGQEYVIPYSDRPDFTGLEDGKVYPASEAIDVLERNYGVPQGAVTDVGYAGGAGGGGTADSPQDDLPWQIVPIAGVTLLLLGGISFFFILKRLKGRKLSK